ncbi:MAG: ABC transporter permease [Deltaproteobacteria bacterium]|mgnify:CR=1 FL=1|jgi:peptide/nickel transport system permease protein|nr:ABC transporter permease [Deltaproteobacteria bacterium]MBT4268800.1 ABC transporter permease [Deltaproteobacteria bacterium]MBT4638328.1 ABC transporter permease [Deltaproteobacteria bacterium]MBT6499658.1 ABC transporter permease [Deltaproteobacteria bacterium]MBT6611650.1 ABC transporter permease [Deltaproteobacteria bacterium]
MFAFTIRRIIQAILVMLVISFIGFAVQYSIGDPVRDMVGIRVSAAEREALREKLGLNDSFWIQYSRFVRNATRGDLGTSYFYSKPALQVILQKAPATLELVFVTAMIIVLVSLPVGIYTAINPKKLFSKITMGISTVGVSFPVFLTAIGLIYLFAVELHWLPSYGRGATVNIGGWETGFLTKDGLLHLILPSIALSSIMLPLFIRLIRAEMMEVLETEYIKYAWAKGLSRRRVWLLHAFKNTLLPVVTVFGVEIGILFAFTILTETVFQWQGMGFMFYEAVERSDTALLVAYLVVIGVIFVLINTLVDILYGLINPMVRIAGTK